ncbi:putative ribosomal subunit interface protein [Bacteriovorax sp. BSW11_IV]|uniref:HPF/RaiA family ribosome-associated protein n=1 Tax=Bacteriovorax sp. BSW11_IV TaxID=1353529 RepID=UPI000389FA3E|nr:HPF/RaiA family ribosome-associated protein [Bacteriovorax sp. BSW11_IV]EQC49209.1 putative ribosomal subunit interface protein [Bacteriovorax sp. BSW11_IV]
MQVHVAYHQVDHSLAFDQFVMEKLNNMKRFFKGNEDVDCVVAKDGKNYIFSLHYKGHGVDKFVRVKSNNVYKSAALGVEKLRNVIRELKSKKASHL